ncbi:hypothetical protein NUSPORA_01482 [Nucleospora cyclopteri]
MLGKLLLIVILLLQLMILFVLYFNNPKGFDEAISSIDEISKGKEPEDNKEEGKEEPKPEETNELLNFSFNKGF